MIGNKLKFVIGIKEITQCLLLSSVLGLTACSGLPKKQPSQLLSNQAPSKVESQQEVLDEEEIDPNLPKVELDQSTLENLLIQNFASYYGNWKLSSVSSLSAAKSSGDYRLAQTATLLALRGNNYSLALDGAQLWVELEPGSENAKNILLISQIGSGNVDDAIHSIEAKKQGRDLEVFIKEIADLVVRQKNDAAGVAVMQNFIDKHPESAQAYLSGAYVAEVFRKYDQAQNWLDQAIALRSDWDLAAQMKADILQSRGDVEGRSAFLETYAVSHPESVSMNINYAADLARQERYQEAYVLMQAVVKQDPTNSPALNYTGALAGQLEEIEQAKRYFQLAINADPKNDEARWSLGRLAMIDEKYITAEKYFDAITTKDTFIDAQIQVANARYHTKGLKRAIGTLELLVPETQGDYVNIALARNRLLLRDYKYEEALGYINEVLLNLPGHLDLLYSRALVAAELKKTDIAEADFRAILAQEPDNADTLNALGYTLADQTERYEEAKVMIAKALELRPDAAHILDSMGWVLYRLNDYEQAIEFLQKAYQQNKEVEIAAHLGEVYWVSGDHQKAMDVWQAAFNKDTENPVLNATFERFDVSLVAEKP